MANVRRNSNRTKRIMGLVPAAGQATRLSPLPFSKELYPIGHMRFEDCNDLRPKPVCMHLLEKMKIAGVKDVFIVLRKGKWDIPAYLGDGSILNMDFAYLIMKFPYGVPYTLNQAFPFTQEAIVVFGFPDIIFQPEDAFVHLLTQQSETKADLVMGLFPTDQKHTMDMVDVRPDGMVRKILIKPPVTNLEVTWIIAVWTPDFTQFMHEYTLLNEKKNIGREAEAKAPVEVKELFIGDVIQAAIQNKLNISSVTFTNGKCLDIGSSENIIKAIKMTT